ncbi:DUF192 domain-containing protein [Alteromonas sediminis]|uniref:DUF192 domain-containing protein n=1 Tax=Alteromonas sediminis TaxID=2259342 RepID=A0A3N5Z5V3_9ALTE|nr:DUF192 domain-containing protein [Alteromonas sediminis]RPJ65764.1 DUF192 domain-containing protein [Alteromonas sediminis]
MSHRAQLLFVLLSMFFLVNPASWSQGEPSPVVFDTLQLSINGIPLELEHAVTYEQRARGLMFRKSMCADCGMIFTFSRPIEASIWMKNTYIPLDLAYVDTEGQITGIYTLEPHDLTSVVSKKKVRYAIEMNRGWFEKNGVKVGDTVVLKE